MFWMATVGGIDIHLVCHRGQPPVSPEILNQAKLLHLFAQCVQISNWKPESKAHIFEGFHLFWGWQVRCCI